MNAAARVDPQALIAALKRAGFVQLGTGRHSVRLGWPTYPSGASVLMVATDPTAPEFESMMTAVLAELEMATLRGEQAQEVLNGVVDPLVEEPPRSWSVGDPEPSGVRVRDRQGRVWYPFLGMWRHGLMAPYAGLPWATLLECHGPVTWDGEHP